MTFVQLKQNKFEIELTAPKFVRRAVGVDLTVFDQVLATSMPSLCSIADLGALPDEQGSNCVLDSVNSINDRLAIFDEASSLSHFCTGNVCWIELIHAGKPSQLVGIILVSFAFRVFEQPSIFVGTANDGRNLQFLTVTVPRS